MVEKIGHIKNPLTVIAMFAAIAEISGTIVLPFMTSVNQSTYIWFLMIFPMFLVSIFFLTLNFNHRVLYAPSDYKSEDNFIKSLRKATTEEKEKKLREEVDEIEEEIATGEREGVEFFNTDDWLLQVDADEDSEPPPVPAPQPAAKLTGNVSGVKGLKLSRSKCDQAKFSELSAKYSLAEDLSINKLSKAIGIEFKRDVSIETSNKRKILYDGIAADGNDVHAVEVKLFRNRHVIASKFDKVLFESEFLANQLKQTDQRNFTLHIYAVIENSTVNLDIVKNRLSEYASKFNINVKVYASTLSELSNEIQYNPEQETVIQD